MLALALLLSWQSLTVYANFGGNWTGLFRTGRLTPVPPSLQAGTFRTAHPAGYDGQYYRFLAHDPLLRGGSRGYLGEFHARRILVPLLAWLVGAGQPGAIDAAYIVIVAASVFAGVWWMASLALFHGRNAAWGLLFLAAPAVLVAVDSMTVDVALASLAACFVWQVQTGNRRWLWWTLAGAALVRETGLLLAVAVVSVELWERRPRRAAFHASAALPTLAWYVYFHLALPPAETSRAELVPHWVVPHYRLGILERLYDAPAYPALGVTTGELVRWLDRLSLLGVVVAFALAVVWLWRVKPVETATALGFFAMLVPAMTTKGFWTPVYGYSRPISPMLVLLLAAGLPRPGAAVLLALACCAAIDLRVSAEMLTQFLGVWNWIGHV